MPKNYRVHSILFAFAIPFIALFLLLLAVSSASAWPAESDLPVEKILPEDDQPEVADAAVQADSAPTLTVNIISSRYAILDNTDPDSMNKMAPRVLVIEAVVTNNSGIVADVVEVDLEYTGEPGDGWVLQGDEDPHRTHPSLAPGEAYYAYWFASYPIDYNLTHVYTVTAMATGFDPVSTSENFFGPPVLGGTVQTLLYQHTGNSGIVQVTADVVVGVAYTITVEHELGRNPDNIMFSPAGNSDYEPSTSRLLNSSVRFHNLENTEERTVYNQLYFPELPLLPDNSFPGYADVMYNLLPLTQVNTKLCPYAGVGTGGTSSGDNKYDAHFCTPGKDNIIPIEGSVSFTMTKEVDRQTVEQGELLNYTLNYANEGTLPLSHAWVWDEIDPATGRIVASTLDPLPDVDSRTESLVAWDLGDIPAGGEPGSSGTLTVTVLVDGNGTDLVDGQPVDNIGYFGINPGSLPKDPALSATVTSLVQAPVVTIEKSDGLETVGNDVPSVYTITVTNDGSIPATNLVITDVLPSGVNYAGGSTEPPIFDGDRILLWPLGPESDLGPGGDSITLTLPISTEFDLETHTVLTNTADVSYENSSGHRYQFERAVDMTTVFRNAGFVEGYAFIDEDGDGYFDDNEEGLAGVTVTLDRALVPVTTTNDSGYYSFRVEFAEWVWVVAGLPDGHFRTTPGAIPVENIFEQTQRVDFGFAVIEGAQFGTIVGLVFEDDNHNGILDGAEGGLSGVWVSSAEAFTNSVQTRDQGQYSLRFDSSRTVTVTEANPADYVSTTPDSVQVAAAVGSEGGSPVNFGDFLGIKVMGKVFDDQDVDGVDNGDPGLAGAIVNAGADSTLTLADGLYTLFVEIEGPGPIDVIESDPDGYISTNAIPGIEMSKLDANTLTIDSPVSGKEYTGGKFGDVQAAAAITITGRVWNDNGGDGDCMANGLPDCNEPGLAGAVVRLSSGMSQTTGNDGDFTLFGPAGTTITVTETNPPDFVSTNAIPGNNAIKWDVDTLVVEALDPGSTSAGNSFGDVRLANVVTISGYVWDDNGDGLGTAGDGLHHDDEPFLAGAFLSLSTGMSQTTGSNGEYLLYGPAGHAITVTERNPAGYISSGAIADDSAHKVDNDRILVDPLGPGFTSSGNKFGDLQPAELGLDKSADPEPVTAGTTLTYTVSYVNSGPSYAQNVVLTDTLPDEVDFGGVVNQPGNFELTSAVGRTIVWTADSLSMNVSDSIVFTVTVKSDVISGTVINNLAEITSNMPDTFPDDNTADIDSTVVRETDLAVSKSASPDPVLAGERLTYTVVVTNYGPSAATGVEVIDTIPVSTTALAATPSHGTFDAASGVWTVGDLALNESAELIFQVAVDADAPDLLTNLVEVAGDQIDNVPENDFFEVKSTVERETDLAVSKTADPEPVIAGEVLTYTVVVTNYGPSAATSVLVTDTVPVSTTAQAAAPIKGSFDPASGEWTVGDLALNESAELIFQVAVDADAPDLLTNQVEVAGDQIDNVPKNDFFEEESTVERETDLAVSKTADPEPVIAGEVITYTVVVTNYGPSAATGVLITDTIPISTTARPADPIKGFFDEETGLWGLGDLALNEVATLVFQVDVDADVNADLTNWVVVDGSQNDPHGGNNRNSVGSSVRTRADLAITKVDNPTTVVAGQMLTYTLEVTNNGPSDATSVVVTDTLPPGLTLVNVIPDLEWYDEQSGRWTIGSLAAGDNAELILEVDVSPVLTRTIVNEANVVAMQIDPVPGNDNASTETEIDVVHDLAVTKSGHADTVVAGTLLTYTIHVSNHGPSAATGVAVVDQLPGGVTFKSASGTQGSFDQNNNTWSVGTLALDGEATLTLVVTVDSDTLGTIRNTATVSGDGSDPDNSYDRAIEDTLVIAKADLGVAKLDDPDPVAVGSIITYTISFENNGPSDALNAVIADNLDDNTTFIEVVSQYPDIWTFSQNGQLLTWQTPRLANGQAGTIVFKVSVHPGTIGALVNDVAISSETDDPYPENDTDQEDTSIGDPFTATIFGFVFDDLNGNGNQDEDEPGLNNVLVTLDDGVTTLTDADGLYYFLINSAGSYKVVETDPDGYFSTTDNQVQVTVTLGTSYRVDFGDAQNTEAQFASILGTVYEDLNGNGVREDGEIGISGVTVMLDDSSSAVTGIYGRYTFSTTFEGSHTIVETDPPGYFSTTDNEVQVEVTVGDAYQVDFGDAKVSSEFAAILGTVYEDKNGNGDRDDGEPGIPGVTVTLDDSIGALTDLYGRYTFSTTSQGVHGLVETDLPGYFSTTDNKVQVNVTLGDDHFVDFGDAPETSAHFASIFGTVFEDKNGDGQRDLGESGIPGVTVTLDDSTGILTDLYGRYTFSTTVAGSHVVIETDPPGYISTTDNDVQLSAELGNDYQVDFGDASANSAFATIIGTVYNDIDGSGNKEDGEPGIPGVTVTLDVTNTVTTDEFGRYTFAVESAGVHTVEESDLPGYFSTTPNLVLPLVILGNQIQIDFGDAAESSLFASIHGTVFEDLNSSGSWDPTEVGLKSVTIALNSNSSTLTDRYGRYSFTTSKVGDNSVEETDPPYYFSTTPNNVTVVVELANGYLVDFGDVPAEVATCKPDIFEEDDIFSEANDLAPGLGQSHDFCDDPADWYKFSASYGSVYTVRTSSWGQRADTFVALYDRDGTKFLTGNDDAGTSSDFSSEIEWIAPHTGEYYLRITNRADLIGFHTDYEVSLEEERSYRLYLPVVAHRYTTPIDLDPKDPHRSSPAFSSEQGIFFDVLIPVEPKGVIYHSCMDAYEVDDTWTQASPILSGVPQNHSFDSDPILWAADKDFVKFTLLPTQIITLTTTSTTGTSTLLELYDDQGVTFGQSGIDQLTFDPGLDGGSFYLSATPVSDDFGCYEEAGFTLTANYKPIYMIYLPIVVGGFPGP